MKSNSLRKVFGVETLVVLGMAALFFEASVPLRAQSNNPYVNYLNAYLPIANVPSMPTGSGLTSTEYFIVVGEDMEERIWGVVSPLSTATSTQKSTYTTQIQTEMNYLMTYCVNGHWWTTSSPYSGDVNSDRFVLSSVMEVFYQCQSHTILTSNLPGWEATALTAVNYQYNNYGQGLNAQDPDWSTPLAGHYPNQDAAYAEIMGDAGLIYGNGTHNYTASAQQFVVDVKNLVQSGGTIPYCDLSVGSAPPYTYYTDGADIDYTDIVIGYLGLYYADTSDANAKAALVAMKSYFPKQLVNAGLSEIASTPWLKHSIAPLEGTPSVYSAGDGSFGVQTGLTSAGAIDTIAGLTGDPVNAYCAQTLLSYSGRFGPNAGSNALVGADFWQSITASAPSTNVLIPDGDINGSRGHFGAFNWVGVLNPGEDTCVGATLASTNLAPNANFEGKDVANGTAEDYSSLAYSGTPVFTVDTSLGYNGSTSSQEITCTGSGQRGEVGPAAPWPVIPGHTYTFSVWYQTSSSLAASAVICQANVVNVVGSTISWSLGWDTQTTGATASLYGSDLSLAATATSVGKWTQMSVTFVAPASAVAFGVQMYNWNGNGSVWYDDVSFTDGTSGATAMGLDSALVLVSPEVGILGTSNSLPLYEQAAYISPLTYNKYDMVSANLDFSIVSSQYQPEEPSDAITPQYPQQAWQVNQTWLMLSDRMVGKVNMTSLTNHQDKYVRMRIRTAPGGLLTELTPSTFTASGTDLTLYENDFTGVAVGPAAQADAYGQPDADEIFLTEAGAADPATYTAGQSHTIALNVCPSTTDGLSGFDYLTNGTLSGFRAQTDLDNYYVWFNTGSSSAPLNFTLSSSTWEILTNLFVGGPGTTVVSPTVVTGTVVNTTVPAYGSVCIQETRNLMPNPGFEQVTSGVPTGFTFESLQGSPTITLDSTDPSHGGNNSVKVAGTGSAEGGVLAPKITIVQGNYYQVTYWYKSGTGLSSSAIVTRLTAWEANGTMTPWSTSWIQSITGGTYVVTNNQLYVTATNPTPGTWNSVTIVFSLSNPTVSLGVECLNWQGNGSVWYDDLFVEQTD